MIFITEVVKQKTHTSSQDQVLIFVKFSYGWITVNLFFDLDFQSYYIFKLII